MTSKVYTAEQVAAKLGISTQTLNIWYRWKRTEPKEESAELIPAYIQTSKRGTRYWTAENIKQLRQFKKTVKKGRNGVMAEITQKYVKRKD